MEIIRSNGDKNRMPGIVRDRSRSLFDIGTDLFIVSGCIERILPDVNRDKNRKSEI
jgi:hypothetical protein